MTAEQYALDLKNQYLDAKQQFENLAITRSLENFEKQGFSFQELKNEVEKLGFKISLAKDLKIPYWKKEAKKSDFLVFYLTENDL